jgi:acetyltransferase-like isoleucine patch superfamily enzyme/glycosyltransferase involved in cell wall biosynthesis
VSLAQTQSPAFEPAAVPDPQRAPVDVIIVAFNEQINLPCTLKSVVGWAHRVFVVDSGSTDGTRELATSLGAEVVEHAWEGYARQKNWALDNLPLESPWTLIVDADEAVPEDLREEIGALSRQEPSEVAEDGFYINRALMFMGKRIRHCGYNPSWNLRLFKRGKARYEDRPVHEHMILQGREGYLDALLLHEDRRGLEYYIAKHNRYSTLEAETLYFGEQSDSSTVSPRLMGNWIQRRRWFRTTLYPKLPAKWLWRFAWMYFVRLGILDGVNGLRFCLLISAHELFTSLKLRELKLRGVEISRPAPLSTTTRQLVEPPRAVTSPLASQSAPRSAAFSPTPVFVDTGQAASPASLSIQREGSPWTLMDNLKRVLWMFTSATLFRYSFHNWYGWRRVLLRCFGAKIGAEARIRPTVRIEIPWNLEVGDDSVVGDYAILYCLGKVTIGRHAVISQYAHLCAGTHDYTSRRFPLVRMPIAIGDEVWVAADAFVAPGVTIGDRSVVGARSTVTRDVPPDNVVAGSPAKFVKMRELAE